MSNDATQWGFETAQIHAGDHVRLVFLLRQRFRLAVRRGV